MKIWRNLLGLVAGPLALLLVVPAAVVALPFLLVGASVRGIARTMDRSPADWTDLIRFEPELGWLPRPGLDTHHEDLNGDAYRVRTDGEGWRGREISLAEADVLVFGDSFAFGNAISEDAFFANLEGGARIKAIGAPGYDMVQELMLMRRYRDALEGRLVVWLVYPGNDLEDNLRPYMSRYRAPFVREASDGWEIVSHHVSREEWHFPSRRPNFETYVDICRPDSLVSRRAFAACEWLLEQGRDLCVESGARLAVVTVPDLSALVQGQVAGVLEENAAAAEHFDGDLVDRRLAEICASLDLPFVPLAEHLSEADYRDRDVHWNRRGHRRVARALADLHEGWETARGGVGGGARGRPRTARAGAGAS